MDASRNNTHTHVYICLQVSACCDPDLLLSALLYGTDWLNASLLYVVFITPSAAVWVNYNNSITLHKCVQIHVAAFIIPDPAVSAFNIASCFKLLIPSQTMPARPQTLSDFPYSPLTPTSHTLYSLVSASNSLSTAATMARVHLRPTRFPKVPISSEILQMHYPTQKILWCRPLLIVVLSSHLVRRLRSTFSVPGVACVLHAALVCAATTDCL